MRYTFYIPILILCLSFQSCFELIEKVKVNENGSGTATFILNMSQSKTKLNSIMKAKTINGHKVPTKSEITNKIAELKKTVEKTNGISNVKTKTDFNEYIFTFQCNFTSVDKLNQVIKTFQKEGVIDKKFPSNYYAYNSSTKTFKRNNPVDLNSKYKTMSSADKKIFNTATYTSIFQFDKLVSSAKNKNAKISKSKKAVMLKSSALNVIQNKVSISNTIQLSK